MAFGAGWNCFLPIPQARQREDVQGRVSVEENSPGRGTTLSGTDVLSGEIPVQESSPSQEFSKVRNLFFRVSVCDPDYSFTLPSSRLIRNPSQEMSLKRVFELCKNSSFRESLPFRDSLTRTKAL